MTLKERITKEIMDAMKRRAEAELRALRAIKAAILLAETAEGVKGELTEADELKLLQKQLKQRQDSYEQFTNAGRNDLALNEKEEMDVIAKYLPQPLTEAEIETEIKNIIAAVGAVGAKDLGKVMKEATAKFAGKADGKVVSEIAKKLLN